MEKREARLIVNKSGGTGYGNTFRATLPSTWVRKMGLGEEDKNILLEFNEEREEIIIKKHKSI